MNPSKNHLLPFFIAVFIFTLAFIWLEIPEILSVAEDDSCAILHNIVQPFSIWSQTSDWWSLLFTYEGRILWKLLHWIFPAVDSFISDQTIALGNYQWVNETVINNQAIKGATYSMIFFNYAMWVVVTCLLYGMFCLLLHSMRKQTATLFVFLAFLVISFVFIRHYNYALFHKYLDGFFYAFILSAIIGVRLCLASQGKKRLFWFIFVLFCLFHSIGYREMSILTLPLFFFALTPVFSHAKKFIYRAAVALASACVFCVSTQYLISLLPSFHKHKGVVMLYSDMSIAAILSGDWDSFQQTCKEAGIHDRRNIESRDKAITLSQIYYGPTLNSDTNESWNRFLQAYINYTSKHPKEMLLSRTISLIQFYSNFHVPQFVRKTVSELCPKAQLSERMWNIKPVKIHDTGGSYEKIYLFATSVIMLLFLFKKRRCLDADMRFFIFISLVGFAYSSGFWVFIPTPDARYHAFPVMAQCLFLSYLAARGCLFCWHYFRNQAPHPHTEN